MPQINRRYANIYGPRRIPHGEAGVVAIFMDRLLNNKACTVYHYKDEPKGMTRDYCYVGDVDRANLLAIEKGSRKAFNISGMPDIIEYMQNGYLAKPFEADDLARGIEWVLEDDERRRVLSVRTRKKVEDELAIEKVAKRYTNLYKEIIGCPNY